MTSSIFLVLGKIDGRYQSVKQHSGIRFLVEFGIADVGGLFSPELWGYRSRYQAGGIIF